MFQQYSNQAQSLKGQSALNGHLSNVFHLEDVSVNYSGNHALRNVKLSIEKGEIVFITGVSGAGKTTLLKVLSGEVTPTTGRVKSPSRNIFISQVFQDLRLMGKMTCRDNLMMSFDSSVYASKAEFEQDLNELSRVMGVQDRLDLKVNDANGGLKQKIAIIRALLSRPDVFIADEPTSSLDFENAQKLFEVLSLYNVKRGLTVVWASHNKELVKKFTGRIVHLDNGRLVYSGHACFI
jgi:cell division transport system ATP-binding protein